VRQAKKSNTVSKHDETDAAEILALQDKSPDPGHDDQAKRTTRGSQRQRNAAIEEPTTPILARTAAEASPDASIAIAYESFGLGSSYSAEGSPDGSDGSTYGRMAVLVKVTLSQ
jgi:hypothetical protein